MRILYAGSPAIAVPTLEALAALTLKRSGGIEIVGVLTNPDSSRGRHGKSEPTDVGAAAAALGGQFEDAGLKPLIVLKPEKLGSEARGDVEVLRPDLLISFAYGRIFGPKFLALFPLGGINIHPSLLPAYRGPTPIPQAILNGGRETGITIQRLALEMDTGDILAQESFPLSGSETTGSLTEEMARRAALLLPQVLRDLAAGTLEARPQENDTASYCGLLSKDDGRIDWQRSATQIVAQIRAYTPWPLSWTFHGEQYLYILKAQVVQSATVVQSADIIPGLVLGVYTERGILVQTGDGVLALTMLQYRTKKALEWRTFLNGVRDLIGARLGKISD
jgi:methionyl-tRNA formyltransferase